MAKRSMLGPTYSETHRVLAQDDKTHSAILRGFRAGGGDRNRWNAADVAAMARAVSAVEDWLELQLDCSSRRELRLRLRGHRRRLELASSHVDLTVLYPSVGLAVTAELGGAP